MPNHYRHMVLKYLLRNDQGRSDGGYIGIYTPKSVYLIFYVVALSPWPIYTHQNKIPGYASGNDVNFDCSEESLKHSEERWSSFEQPFGYGFKCEAYATVSWIVE